MSIRVIALPHPFDSTNRIEKELPQQPVRALYAALATGFGTEHCYCEIDGRRITDLDYVPPDGSTVYLKTIPGGGDNRSTGTGMKVAGGLLVAVGVALSIFTVGIGVPIGAGLIGAGIGLFAGGMALFNLQIPQTSLPEAPVPRPGISGSRNRARPYGSVPVLFGRHLVTPDLAAHSHVTIENNQIYLVQLFCAGYSDMEIELDSFKIGDTKLTELGSTGSISEILSGNDSVFRMELLTGSDGGGTLYPRRVTPIEVNRPVKETLDDGSDGSVIVTTPAETTAVQVNLHFPQGLFRLNDDGSRASASVTVDLFIKPSGADDSEYVRFGFVHPPGAVVTGNDRNALFFPVRRELSAGSWTVRIGTVGNAGEREFRAFHVTTVNAYRDGPPVAPGIRRQVTLIALKTRATDRLNNAIDNFNFVAKALAPVYAGQGSGPSSWSTATTRNPASALLYALRGQVNRKPVEDRHIDWPAFEALYTWCERHQYYCDAVLADRLILMRLLTNIACTARAIPARRDGMFSVIQDIARESETQLFTPANSIDYTQDICFADIPPALEMQFIAAADDQGRDIWKDDVLRVYDTPDGTPGDLDPAHFQNVPLWGITSARQAFLQGMYSYACMRLRPRRHTITADFEFLMCSRGDRIKYSGDSALTGIAWGRITGLVTEGNAVTAFVLDERVEMQSGRQYRIRVRSATNVQTLYDVITETAVQNHVTLNGAVPLATAPESGDLFVLGEIGSIEVDLVITDIQPLNDSSARLVCVDYSPELFALDEPGFTIPPWAPGVSVGGAVDSGVPSDPPPAWLAGVNERITDAYIEGAAKLFTDFRFAASDDIDTAPSIDADNDNPGDSWTDIPGAVNDGEYLRLR